MNCIQCMHGRLQKSIADIPTEIKGEKFFVRMCALVCPKCSYVTVSGADMPEYMRLTADAYRTKHGLLTSVQIRERRMRLRMTQEQFASYVGVGIASIKRWELGQIQDVAMDRLIRIMTDIDEARENLIKVNALTAPIEPTILGAALT